MPSRVEQITRYLCCPDDKTPLEYRPDELRCSSCARAFRVFDDRIVELLPREPTPIHGDVGQRYIQDYLSEFNHPFHVKANAEAWGAPETKPAPWVQKRMRQVRRVFSLITTPDRGTNDVLCDLSAGSGYYTLAYAGAFKHVLHCDLSIDALNYADQKARAMRIPNIVFLRIDYTNPPFSRSLDTVLCFDTLIRGEAHERLLLTTIASCLRLRASPSWTFTTGGIIHFAASDCYHKPLAKTGAIDAGKRSRSSVVSCPTMSSFPFFRSSTMTRSNRGSCPGSSSRHA
jgi:hypothetical protein